MSKASNISENMKDKIQDKYGDKKEIKNKDNDVTIKNVNELLIKNGSNNGDDKNITSLLSPHNTSFGESANRDMDVPPPVLIPEGTHPFSPQPAKDPNKTNKCVAKNNLNKNDDDNDVNNDDDNYKILKIVNELFGVPMDESMDLSPPVLIKEAVASTTSESVRYSSESLINSDESEGPNNQGNENDPEVYIVKTSPDNFIAEEISKEVDLNNQSSSGTETGYKDQQRSSNGVVYVQGGVGFSDGVAVTSDELVVVIARPSERPNPNRKRKGILSTLSPIYEEVIVETSNGSYENINDKADNAPKGRLNMNGHNGNRSNSPLSSSSDDEFLPINMSKALKDKREIMKTRQIGIDIDEEHNPVKYESAKDSIFGSDNSDLSTDEDLNLEALKKIADRFLTKNIKRNIVCKEKKRKKSSSEDSHSDSSENTIKEKYKKARKNILDNAAIETSLEVDKKRGKPKKNLDRAESEENKEKIESAVKRRGRKPKKLGLHGDLEFPEKTLTKEPAKSLKRRVQFECSDSKSDSEVESQKVTYNITKKYAKIPKKHLPRPISSVLIDNSPKEESKPQSPAKKLGKRASIKPVSLRSNSNIEVPETMPDNLIKNKAVPMIRPRRTSTVKPALMENIPKKVSKKSPAKRINENVQIRPYNFRSILDSQKDASSLPMKKAEVPKKRRGRPNSEITLSKKRKLSKDVDNTLYILAKNNIKHHRLRSSMHLIFNGINAQNYIKSIESLGGTIIDDPTKATVLVTDRIRRTFKFFCAISRSIPIVSIKWVKESLRKHEFLDTDKYILHDEVSEIKFDFKLRDSLTKSSKHLLLKGYTFIISPKVYNGHKTEFKRMIQIAGGKALVRVPKIWVPKTIIISCEEDIPKVKEWILKTSKDISVPVVTTEFVLSGMLKQNLDYEEHRLEI